MEREQSRSLPRRRLVQALYAMVVKKTGRFIRRADIEIGPACDGQKRTGPIDGLYTFYLASFGVIWVLENFALL